MSNGSTEGRTHSIFDIHTNIGWSEETQKVHECIRRNWVLNDYIKAMRNNGNLTSETLAEFFYFAAETTEDIWNGFMDVNIDNIDWNELAEHYRGA